MHWHLPLARLLLLLLLLHHLELLQLLERGGIVRLARNLTLALSVNTR